MNNSAFIITLRELMVILMHNRTLREKSADALRYCREQIVEEQLAIGVYGEFQEIVDHLKELADENNRIAPDDLLRSGGDLLLSILLLYERLAAEKAVNHYMAERHLLN